MVKQPKRLVEYLPLGVGYREAKIWLSGVKNWSIDENNNIAVGAPKRIMFVGQAPTKLSESKPAFSGLSGTRLRKLFDCANDKEFYKRFDALNIFPKWPGKADHTGTADRFPLFAACAIAELLTFRSSRVLLFGKAIEVFADDWDWFEWFKLSERTLAVALPHPSPRNRWWNDPVNKARFQSWIEKEIG